MISSIAEPVPEVIEPPYPTGLTDALENRLVRVFKLLSDESRLRIIMYLLREDELHVTAMCERLKQSQPAVSHHLALLRESGILECRRDGKHNFYSVRRDHFHTLMGELFGSIVGDEEQSQRLEQFMNRPNRLGTLLP